jgi:hypothetical protein
MKKLFRINILILTVVLAAFIFSFTAFEVKEDNVQIQILEKDKDHRNTAAELIESRKRFVNFRESNIFTESSGDNMSVLNKAVSTGAFMRIDRTELKKLYDSKSVDITLNIPGENSNTVKLLLSRVYFMPENFSIELSSGTKVVYKQGLYYQGVIEGDNSSMAAISIFEDDVIGIVSNDDGNYNLGAITDNDGKNTSEYIFYNESALLKEQSFTCGVPDSYNTMYRNSNASGDGNTHSTPHSSSTVSPVTMYYVCDYQMFLDKGSNAQNVANYVSAVFNQVNLLYQNESLQMDLAPTIFVYDTPDPYRSFTTGQTFEILKAFGTRLKNNFTGDLAQLLSTRTPVTGAIAWVRVLCQSYEPTSQSGRYAFSEIENTYNNVPVYSWTVEVIAHETGHNYGSMHTHACVWPTASGQIDSCYASEGGCVTGTRPIANGTIMSYCHIPPGGGINFNRGFGPLPGDTIRLRYDEALCLDNPLNSSEQPLDFVLLQNYPNPFNPSTNIKFALPEAGLVSLRVYDLTGREVAKLINSSYYPIGIFSYTLDASYYNLASGVYMYKIDVSRENNAVYSEIKKMVLVK